MNKIEGVMQLKAYEITTQRTLAEIPAGSLSSEWYQDATHRWLDIKGGKPEALRELLAPLSLHPLVLEVVLFCVSRLRTVESKAFKSKEMGLYLRDLAGTLQNIQSAMQRFEASLSDLHQQYLLTQQDKMNSRLQILTVISAVFLPLSLLAGIYGMNFVSMPELQWPYGYPVVLGLMAVIVAVMLNIFHHRGWFK